MLATRHVLFVSTLLSALALAGCPDKNDGNKPAPSASASAAPSASAAASAAASASAAPSASAAASASADPAASASAAPSASAAASASGKPAASASAGVACGSKTNPCPLQKWMQDNANPAVSAGDTAALATALEQMQKFAPAGYTNWVSISKDGAKAAKAGDLAGAKASCRSCHDQYKNKYKTEMRDRKI